MKFHVLMQLNKVLEKWGHAISFSLYSSRVDQSIYDFLFQIFINGFLRTKDGSVQKCTTGYCCANNSGCCINYMELWWFWLIWVRIYCTGVVVVWLVLVVVCIRVCFRVLS